MTSLLIANGRVIDPEQGLDRITNLLIEDGKIAGYDVPPNDQDRVIDATDRIVAPGLIDTHAELREPGLEDDETIASGAAAAVAGGYTTIACLPNTNPPIDTQPAVQYVRSQAERAAQCRVEVVACVSKDRQGEQLAEIGSLVEAGAVAFSDATSAIQNPELLRRAFQYCGMFDKPILNPPQMNELARHGIMHEGLVSLRLGLPGLPVEAEDVMTSRDCRLADATGGRIHLMSISTAGSVELVRRAKRHDIRVTAAICPHHLALTDEALDSFDSQYKVMPPLRSKEHVEALIEGLRDGAIDVIASGHAPHAPEKKMQELDQAPFGMVAFETALSLVITTLIEPGHLDWPAALAKLTSNPARIFGLDRGSLGVGMPADVTVIDPHATWRVRPEALVSKSSNTPLAGWDLKGRADYVIVAGRVKKDAESANGTEAAPSG